MIRRPVTIINRLGLHARAASKLVETATGYSSDVWLERDSKRINGKSIMGVLMLAAAKDTELTLEVAGEDESQALSAITQLIASRFGEDD